MVAKLARATLIFIGIIAVVFMLAGCVGMKEITINNVDLAQVADGIYGGFFDGGPVKAAVSVSVQQHKITDIQILQHDNGRGKKAESIVDSVIGQQSLGVDAVSGATYSSKVILKATEIALQKGIIGEELNQ